MSIRIFAGYSKRFLTSRLPGVVPYRLNRSVARGIRVLWYMREMGEGWLTEQDLRMIGAGQWKALRYTLPDLVHDMLIDEAKLKRKKRRTYLMYKINNAGLKVLDAVDAHVRIEYEKAVERINGFKEKHSIETPANN